MPELQEPEMGYQEMTIANQIAIDPEFSRLIPPLQPDELAQLEANILAEGCRDALVVWRGLLLDGHNRLRICEEHGLPYRTIEIDLPDREAAADWIDANQLGRRNLTADQMSLLRGRRYNRTKRQGERTDLTSDQNDTKLQTAEVLAQEYGVSAPTIKRDGQFARAVEELKPFVPDIQERVMSGYIPSRQAVIEAAQEPETAEQKLTKAHVSYNSGDNEWYTPPEYIKAAVHVMGGIDLDPASTEAANAVVGATRFYTREEDGLKHDWTGRIWMNPPYAQPLIGQFCEKLVKERGHYDQAVVLVNNATETKWFQSLLSIARAICLPEGRVRFWAPDKVSTPLQGQAVIYIGENVKAFEFGFGSFGTVLFA